KYIIMKNKAIVIGATGLVGSSLVNQLAESKYFETIITITRRPVEHPSDKVVNEVVDFDQLEDHASLFKGDIFFSCLGTTLKRAGSIAAQRKVDFEYQLKAAQLAADNGVGHYLLVSSSGATPKSRSPYMKMKGELEEAVKSLEFKRISIFQPSVLLGQRNEFRLGEKLAGWVIPAICLIPGLKRFRPIQGAEVAAKMIRVSRQTGRPLEVFRLDEVFIQK
ncbi:MAG: NAD-dependent epimerase/dehydratase family protein, partial [Desulfobacterales bacterium]|nr:NAD-dependent epimerase/dehydratase family protein [Desulfobacterales bacterium]